MQLSAHQCWFSLICNDMHQFSLMHINVYTELHWCVLTCIDAHWCALLQFTTPCIFSQVLPSILSLKSWSMVDVIMHKIAATHALCIQDYIAIFSTPQHSSFPKAIQYLLLQFKCYLNIIWVTNNAQTLLECCWTNALIKLKCCLNIAWHCSNNAWTMLDQCLSNWCIIFIFNTMNVEMLWFPRLYLLHNVIP
jgi:hypothetical protein